MAYIGVPGEPVIVKEPKLAPAFDPVPVTTPELIPMPEFVPPVPVKEKELVPA